MTRDELQRKLTHETVYTSAQVGEYLDDAEKLGLSPENVLTIYHSCRGFLPPLGPWLRTDWK